MCDEGAAVDITAKRIPKMLDDDLFTDELLQVEESHTVLDQSDARNVTEEKKRSLLARETYEDFLSDFKEARKEHPVGGAQRKTRGKQKPTPALPKLPANLEMVDQKQARVWMPPGSCLWKSRSDAACHGKVPGFGKVSRSVRAYGEDLALRYVFQESWRRHLSQQGSGIDACPVLGLF